MTAAGYQVPQSDLRPDQAPRQAEFRFFKEAERATAWRVFEALPEEFRREGSFVYVPGYEDSAAIRQNHFEFWFPRIDAPGTDELGIGADLDWLAERPSILTDAASGTPWTINYELRAQGWVLFLPITLRASYQADLFELTYNINSKVVTTGLADILVNYNLDMASTGFMLREQLASFSYISQNEDGETNRRVELRYDDLGSDFSVTATPAFASMGNPPATNEQVLGTKDPLTALINFALEPRLDANKPCGGPIKVFDGRQLTHFNFEYVGMEDARSEAWQGSAIVCDVEIERIAGYEDGSAGEGFTSIDGPIKMYLAPLENGATVPVRIEISSEQLGDVVVQASELNIEPASSSE